MPLLGTMADVEYGFSFPPVTAPVARRPHIYISRLLHVLESSFVCSTSLSNFYTHIPRIPFSLFLDIHAAYERRVYFIRVPAVFYHHHIINLNVPSPHCAHVLLLSSSAILPVQNNLKMGAVQVGL
jgi:hypothetical protein